MSKSSRRSTAKAATAATATTKLAIVALLSSTLSSADASQSASRPQHLLLNSQPSSSVIGELVPTFTCGTSWRDAYAQCSSFSSTASSTATAANGVVASSIPTLCPTGDSSSCPSNQHCYAGIPCSFSLVEQRMVIEEKYVKDSIEQQQHVKGRFVCASSYEEAVESLSQKSVQYCNSGTSDECPSSLECYASVFSSSSTSNESVGSTYNESLTTSPTPVLSSYITEPILLNSTSSQDLFESPSSSSSLGSMLFGCSF